MQDCTKHSPIIIIGMHRSGTSMVANVLRSIGLFVGRKRDVNNEAVFFQKLNFWILEQCGARVDNPECIDYLFDALDTRKLVVSYIDYMLRTPRIIEYLGWKTYFVYKNLFNIDFPWGWKDPANTLTLPIWLDIFPNARVVHVLRHGVDVAMSLTTRERQAAMRGKERYFKLRRKLGFLYWLRPKKSGFGGSIRCSSLEGAFTLWESYLERAIRQVDRLGRQAMTIRYEDIVRNPEKELKSLCRFCEIGTSATAVLIHQQALKVRPNRAYAYRSDPIACAFADKMGARLAKFGYSA